jgi:hypothetical protein
MADLNHQIRTGELNGAPWDDREQSKRRANPNIFISRTDHCDQRLRSSEEQCWLITVPRQHLPVTGSFALSPDLRRSPCPIIQP